jgi:hypothetical protein
MTPIDKLLADYRRDMYADAELATVAIPVLVSRDN